MRVLITGAGGFAGKHLVNHLADTLPGIEMHGTTLHMPVYGEDQFYISWHEIDLKDEGHVFDLINSIKPDHIYHLAAQSAIPRSIEFPWETLENNIRGQLNIFQACIQQNIAPRILVVSSSHVYGSVPLEQLPIVEETRFCPTTPYSVSKITQDMLGLQYYLTHKLPIIRVRAFNHIGPGQVGDFAAPSFASQIAKIEIGLQPPVIEVGNLSPQRDFTDVRDIVTAYQLLMEKGIPGEVYNVCSGKARSTQALLDGLLSQSNLQITVTVNRDKFRPAEIPVLIGDYSKLHKATGWHPIISFNQSLHDILEDFRRHYHPLQS